MPSGYRPPAKFRRIAAAGNIRDLCGCECDYVVGRIIAEENIEIVEVPACGTKNQDALHGYPPGEVGSFYLIWSRWFRVSAVPPITGESDFGTDALYKEGLMQEVL